MEPVTQMRTVSTSALSTERLNSSMMNAFYPILILDILAILLASAVRCTRKSGSITLIALITCVSTYLVSSNNQNYENLIHTGMEVNQALHTINTVSDQSSISILSGDSRFYIEAKRKRFS